MFNGAMNLLSTVLGCVRIWSDCLDEPRPWHAPESPALPNNFLQAKAHLSAATASLTRLAGARVLFLADDENLRYSARDWGYSVSFDGLRRRFERSGAVGEFHAFFSRMPADCRRVDYFIQRGWHAHVTPIEMVETYEGSRTRANSDNRILYEASSLIRSFRPDVVVIGSGDGDLTCDLARMIREEPAAPLILTVSVPGSVSTRLNAEKNPHIWGNILLGCDLLRPLSAHRSHHANNRSARPTHKRPNVVSRNTSHNESHVGPSPTTHNGSKNTTITTAHRSSVAASAKKSSLSVRSRRGQASREAVAEATPRNPK